MQYLMKMAPLLLKDLYISYMKILISLHLDLLDDGLENRNV